MPNRRDFLAQLAASSLAMTCGRLQAERHAPRGMRWHAAQDIDAQRPAATSSKAMIVATTGPVAIEEGLALLKAGGSAADAVLSTALAQIALCAGCWVSYAGRMTAVYFDAKTGKVSALNACYDAPRNETDPLTIPRSGTPSGRTALVPGFLAGVQSLHQRFGNLEFARIFDQAIELAEEGFPLSQNMASLIQRKEQVLMRYAGGRSVFQKGDGTLFAAGDHFKQGELAATLKGVAADGAEFCYTGPWAKNFVKAVRAAGGKITLEDLEKYEPTWSEPLVTELAGSTIHVLPEPNRGGPLACVALNLAAAAGLPDQVAYAESADVLTTVVRIEQAMRVSASPKGREHLADLLGLDQLSLNDMASPELGQELWPHVDSPKWDQWWRELRGLPSPTPSEHSDAVVAVDEAGNVAAILHTINTAGWGTTGLFVDGVSIPDSAAGQQQGVAAAGPGGRISDHGPPLLVTSGGIPILASSATGSGNINASWQCVLNCLANGMSPQAAADQPRFYQGQFQRGELVEGLFSELGNRGLDVTTVERFGGFQMGFWAGLAMEQKPRLIRGGKIRRLDGLAMGY